MKGGYQYPCSSISRVCLGGWVHDYVCENVYRKNWNVRPWVQTSVTKMSRKETKISWAGNSLETSILDSLFSDVVLAALKSNKTTVFTQWE